MCYRRCAFVNHLAEWAKTQLSNCCVATHHFALYSSVVDRGQERLLRRDEAKGLEVYVTERTDIITCSVYMLQNGLILLLVQFISFCLLY